MTLTWTPGYLGTITIDGDDFTVYANVVGMSMAKTNARKPTFGVKHSRAVGGQQAWTMQISGHIAAEGPTAELIAAANSETPLAYSIQMGDAAGATDSGSFAGDLILSGLEISADSEGEWDWSATADIDGENAFTPATP